MKIFQKQIKFVSAICPKCNGNLQLDTNLERAFCQYCGAQCIVENASKSKRNKSKLEIVLDFVERQQASLKREELEREKRAEKKKRLRREEKERKREIRRQNGESFFRKNWKMITGIGIAIIVLSIVLKKLGI